MIEQVAGHIPFKRLYDEDFNTSQILNYAHCAEFPETTKVLELEFQARVIMRGNGPSYHNPEVIRNLPKQNCSMPQLESSPHVWHFRDTDTSIEFLVFSDLKRKNYFKGTRVEVRLNGYEKNDEDLAAAYSRLLEYFAECFKMDDQLNERARGTSLKLTGKNTSKVFFANSKKFSNMEQVIDLFIKPYEQTEAKMEKPFNQVFFDGTIYDLHDNSVGLTSREFTVAEDQLKFLAD